MEYKKRNGNKQVRLYVVFLFAVLYFFYTLYFDTSFSLNFKGYWYDVLILVKIITFLTIFYGFNSIYNIILKIKQKDKEVIKYTKWFLFYFLLNILFIYITKPFATLDHDYFYITDFLSKNNDIHYAFHIIPSIFVIISNSIFHSIYGTPIMCAILYSLVFVFFIDTVQKHISKKYWFLSLFLFCTPLTLLWNLVQYRQIYSAYILLFILTALFRYRNKKFANISFALFWGIICSLLACIRSENLFLFFLLPFIVYSLKIVSKKSFAIFLVLFFVLSCIIVNFQKTKGTEYYTIHNLSYIYCYYKEHNLPITEYEKYEHEFQNVYINLDNYENCGEFVNAFNLNLSDKNSLKKLEHKLIKMFLAHSYNLIQKNLRDLNDSPENEFLFFKQDENNTNYNMGIISFIFLNPNKLFSINNNSLNSVKKYYSNYKNIAMNTIYNIKINIILLFLIGLYGIITRQKYYILSCLILCSLLIPTLIFMPFALYKYLYPVIFSSWALFYMIIISIIDKHNLTCEENLFKIK